MSEELVKRLRSGGETCGIDACKIRDAKSGCLCAIAADRIEALEAALRGIAYMVPKTDSNGFWWHQKIARLALGEKEDGQSMG